MKMIHRIVSALKKIFFVQKFLSSICDNLVSADMDIQKYEQKRTYFSTEKKKRTKTNKSRQKRILRKSTLTTTFFCYQEEKALKNIQLKNSEMNYIILHLC